MTERRNTCRWCKTYKLEHNPGDYYHEKDCAARFIKRMLETATDPDEISRLKVKLERARYVGD